MFKRRLGITNKPSLCSGGHYCPEVLELESGDVAIIGTDITTEAVAQLPAGCGCGPTERIVQIPRALLVQAGAEMRSAD